MARQVMRRTAADNAYLHKDFHGAFSVGIEYLHERFGEAAVREYLREFTHAFYAPLKQAIRERGLAAVKEHYERVYRAEGGAIRATGTADELIIEVTACPAVAHMRQQGYAVARLFHETTRTVNDALCEGTPFAAELRRYDPRTGASEARFFRRRP
jgi:hypothetical protein